MMTQSEVNSSGMPSNIDHNSNQNKADAKTNKNDSGNPQGNSCHTFPNLGRQSSIYSLTLDEFQQTLCENGKNFGSMNMDEFLSSIWTAEENQAHHHHHDNSTPMTAVGGTASGSNEGMIAKQPSLPRQGSLTLPAPLCRKTVDEVWTEIQRTQQHPSQKHSSNPESNSNSNTQRQPTFGEMTLEDFLVKAGVVQEPSVHPAQQQHPPYSFSPSQFITPPMMGMAAVGGYPTIGGDTSTGFATNGNRSNNGYPVASVPTSVACYPGRVTNGGPPSASACGVGLSPVSPVSPDEMVDNSAAHYGLDMVALRGRKRIIDGPVEKVVERRQRRMIKNRESAARSRARKQAYTVELEAELNQLREENTQLKHALVEMERQRKRKYREEQKQVAAVGSSRSDRVLQKLKEVRRIQSCCL